MTALLMIALLLVRDCYSSLAAGASVYNRVPNPGATTGGYTGVLHVETTDRLADHIRGMPGLDRRGAVHNLAGT